MPQEMKYGGKYQTGGPIPKNEFGFYGDITPEMLAPIQTSLNEDFSDPETIAFYQQQGGLNVDRKLGPETFDYLNRLSNQSSAATSAPKATISKTGK